jgi:DNA-binding NarL/FixJ family response regulator
MQPLHILIADGRDDVRRRVRARLEKQTGWKVCGEASTGPETVARTIELNPDVVLLDEGLPGLSGVEVMREISRVAPDVLVLTLTLSTPDREQMNAQVSTSGGAHRVEIGHTLVDAIKTLVSARALDDERARASTDHVTGSGQAPLERERNVPLTSREREVLRLLADGKSNKEIGVILNISTRTVETHRARVMRKLGLHSMNQLVRYAIRHRIISA